MAAFEWNSPSAGDLARQIDGHVDAHDLGQVSEDRILLHAPPLRPQPLRSIPQERRLARRDGGRPILGKVGEPATNRLTIMPMASIRAGPQA